MHQRTASSHPVVVTFRGQPPFGARLSNISQGGALVRGAPPSTAGARGLLEIQGLKLPVPFIVVESDPNAGLRLRFDIEGLAYGEFLRQFDRLVGEAPVPRTNIPE